MKPAILVVDDDRKTVDLIRLYLEKDSYRVLVAYDGQTALNIARNQRPGLIILDLMLPKVDGLDICRQLRSESQIPIIMLTAMTTEDDKLAGLDLGADDYVTKPFSPRELVARVRAVLRRGMAEKDTGPEQILFGDLEVDFVRHEARIDGSTVQFYQVKAGRLWNGETLQVQADGTICAIDIGDATTRTDPPSFTVQVVNNNCGAPISGRTSVKGARFIVSLMG